MLAEWISRRMQLVDPLVCIGDDLCRVQNPASYIGCDFAQIIKPHDKILFNFAIAFPDIYEIAMSNQAIKIIYNGLNSLPNVRCERVFAVAKDFEELLRQKHLPLYTLETGMPLYAVDMIGFSIGYELGIMGLLSILDLGGIPLKKIDRDENCPIVIVGGCGATNPLPFSLFCDGVFIGEAEDAMFDLVSELAKAKAQGATRKDLLSMLDKHPNVWTACMTKPLAMRAVDANFALRHSENAWRPLASIKPVHDHGVVEIMRGCPNGCRFCHAGIYYRPQRCKSFFQVINEVDTLVNVAGYTEISLTSLSSGDYIGIDSLLAILEQRYSYKNVSFQLPSLKVNSFTLPLLQRLSRVRKSGLTFAIETPEEMWQLCLNKEVYSNKLVAIIKEAKQKGWSAAKFYFMIGLPLPCKETSLTEEEAIVAFMKELQAQTRISCSVNVGIFVPKPHTAFERVSQISAQEARRKFEYIKANLPYGKFKVTGHSTQTALIEGLFSRGDEKAGEIALFCYKAGARLDAWEDNIKSDFPLWQQAFKTQESDIEREILRQRSPNERLPWHNVSLGVKPNFFYEEYEKSQRSILTPCCKKDCDNRCGVCNNSCSVNLPDTKTAPFPLVQNDKIRPISNIKIMYRCVFAFTKTGGAKFISYLSMLNIFYKAFLRAKLDILYTHGFNPLPRLEFASTIPVGVSSKEEIASCLLYDDMDACDFVLSLNKVLPVGFKIERALIFAVSNLRKRESLASSLWGSEVELTYKENAISFVPEVENVTVKSIAQNKIRVLLPFEKDKIFRTMLEEHYSKKLYEIARLAKTKTLAIPVVSGYLDSDYSKAKTATKDDLHSIKAVNHITIADKPVSYFELYEHIKAINKNLISLRQTSLKQQDTLL